MTIPNTVTYIGRYAFNGCSRLTGITIPNSVTSIRDWAFAGCSGLTSIDIPNSITSIGNFAFAFCSGLTSVTIPNSVTTIGERLFSSCSSLMSITIPNSVTSIGNYAFYECNRLTSVTIPNSVISIGDGSFSRCSSLQCITIPISIAYIGSNPFMYCYGLREMIVASGNNKYDSRDKCNAIIETESDVIISGCQNTIIPTSVKSIGDEAFTGCHSLKSISIPNSITTIGNYVFRDCGLKDVYSYISDLSNLSLGSSVFGGGSSNRTLYVPFGSANAYQSDENWYPYFGQIVEMDPLLASSIELDKRTAVIIDGETLQITAIILPVNAIKTTNWSSSNPAVATVDDDGLVTAHSVGTATITAMTTDGSNLSASCVVTVKSLSATECFSMPDGEVLHGETITIPVRMNNEATVLAFQTDIYLPEGFTVATDGDDEPMVVPADRLTSDHLIVTETVSSGAVRVVCYTPSMQPISGNEGDLLYITVNVPDDAAGNYAIYLRNSRLTIDDFSEVRIPDAGAVINVKTYIPGDVNDTHTVNVADIVTTVRYVMEQDPTPFIFDAADMNGDGEVTVTDIMLIARLIMYPTMNAPRHAPAMVANGDRMSGEDIALTTGETRTVSINLDNEAQYSAFQFDLHLPEGMTASNFCLTDRAASHALEVNILTNGTIRTLCYTPTIEAIDGTSGAVLTFDVTATSPVTGDISVECIELVTTGCQGVKLEPFAIGVQTATAVNELQTGKTVAKVEYFNLAGQRLTHPASGVTLIVTTYTDGTRTTTKLLH